jgi:hypothetical protein
VARDLDDRTRHLAATRYLERVAQIEAHVARLRLLFDDEK